MTNWEFFRNLFQPCRNCRKIHAALAAEGALGVSLAGPFLTQDTREPGDFTSCKGMQRRELSEDSLSQFFHPWCLMKAEHWSVVGPVVARHFRLERPGPQGSCRPP